MSDNLNKFLSGVQSLSAPISSAVNAVFTGIQNHFNRRWTEQQNDLAYQRQRTLIDEQRNYDSPLSQMQRLMAAGLNPNLIYDQVDASALQAQNAPNAAGSFAGVAPQIDPLSMSQAALNYAQVDRLNTQNNLDTQITDATIKKFAVENNLTEKQARLVYQQTENAKVELSKIKKEIDLLGQDEIARMIDNYYQSSTMDDRIKTIAADRNISEERAKHAEDLVLSAIAQAYGAAEQSQAIAHYNRQITQAEVSLKNSMASYYSSLSNKTATEGQYVQLQKDLLDYYGDMQYVSQIMDNLTSGQVPNLLIKQASASQYGENPRRRRIVDQKLHQSE